MKVRLALAENGVLAIHERGASHVCSSRDELTQLLQQWRQKPPTPRVGPRVVDIEKAENGYIARHGRRVHLCSTWQELENFLKGIIQTQRQGRGMA